MNAQAIQSTEILVRFANPAEGNRPPNIHSSDGVTYGVKPVDFGRFQPGGRYRIDYVEKEGRGKWQGRKFRDIVKCEPVASGARAPSPSQTSVSGGEGVTPSGEFEFVTRMLAAYVACCGVGKTVDDLTERGRMLRTVYRNMWP